MAALIRDSAARARSQNRTSPTDAGREIGAQSLEECLVAAVPATGQSVPMMWPSDPVSVCVLFCSPSATASNSRQLGTWILIRLEATSVPIALLCFALINLFCFILVG